jgi:chromosome segregation ATPase
MNLIDPAFLKLVEDKHLLLNEAIKDLEHRNELSLSIQKQELHLAHADEIQKLQDEIALLKLDKINLEEKIASDERVCSLENERDYYRKESMKLNATVESMKSKLDKSEKDRKKMKREIEMLKLGH